MPQPDGFYWVLWLRNVIPFVAESRDGTWFVTGDAAPYADANVTQVLGGPLQPPNETTPVGGRLVFMARAHVGRLREMSYVNVPGQSDVRIQDGRVLAVCGALDAILDHLGVPQ